MSDCFEQSFLINCATRISLRFSAHSMVARELSDWLENVDLGFYWAPRIDRHQRCGVPTEIWKKLKWTLQQAGADTIDDFPDRVQKNTILLADYVGLDKSSTTAFALAVRCSYDGPLNDLCRNIVSDARISLETLFSCLTEIPARGISQAFCRDGDLIQSGLLEVQGSANRGQAMAAVPEGLLAVLELATGGVEDILSRLFNALGAPEVDWEDFRHLGPAADFAARLLTGALKNKTRGVNILFYGPLGTGKTEFCKVLAKHIGADLRAVGECDSNGGSPSRYERIQELRLGQKLLAERADTLVLFDEMEDIVSEFTPTLGFTLQALSSGHSKVHTNRIFETNPVPTLWTCNDIGCFDSALLRRLTLAIEIRCPSQKVRQRIWKRLAKKQGVHLDDGECASLASHMPDPPALTANALRAAALSGGGIDDVIMAVDVVSKVMRGGHARPSMTAALAPSFKLDLTNADADLALLSERLSCESANRAVSLCLAGPPGTGKSAYARYLAEKMDLPVIQKRGSDILSMWVGGTEKNIAEAFSEARDTGAFLIFDEADSLLSSRDMAHRTFEVSQVNEMLTWMESHPLPFVCTTNLAARLDPASQRRFTFRVTFRPLNPHQLKATYQLFFNAKAPAEISRLDALTPGDFANVRRRVDILGVSAPKDILAELRAEDTAKPGRARQIGFVQG